MGVAALCEAYNDFVVDWCSEERSRLFGAAFLPAQDAALTAKEIHRAAGLGLPVGLIRPIDAQAKYPNAAAPSMMAPGAYDEVFRAFAACKRQERDVLERRVTDVEYRTYLGPL